MGRTARPWFDGQKNQWTAYFNGRRECLAVGRENKQAAKPRFAERHAFGTRATTNKVQVFGVDADSAAAGAGGGNAPGIDGRRVTDYTDADAWALAKALGRACWVF